MMSIAILIIQIVILLIFVYIFKWYLPSYFQEKGKNLATKQDIAEITTKVEQVKHEYSSNLELIKTVLSTRLFIHQVRYQNEFNMLVSLSKKTTKLGKAMDDFEISLLPTNSDDMRRQELVKVFTAMGALMEEYTAYKPFYPQEIYESLIELHELDWVKVTLQAEKKDLIRRNAVSQSFIDKVKKNNHSLDTKEMSEAIEKIYTAIRKRIQYWEKLHIA